MYPACILKDARILMYPDVSQTYLTCSVTFEENTYPKGVQDTFGIQFGYTTDTSGYTEIQNHDTCILRYKIHAGYMQVTCILTVDQDTCGIHPRYIMRYIMRYMYSSELVRGKMIEGEASESQLPHVLRDRPADSQNSGAPGGL